MAIGHNCRLIAVVRAVFCQPWMAVMDGASAAHYGHCPLAEATYWATGNPIETAGTHPSGHSQSGYSGPALQFLCSHNYQFRGCRNAGGTSRAGVKPFCRIDDSWSCTAFGHIRLCEPASLACASQDPHKTLASSCRPITGSLYHQPSRYVPRHRRTISPLTASSATFPLSTVFISPRCSPTFTSHRRRIASRPVPTFVRVRCAARCRLAHTLSRQEY